MQASCAAFSVLVFGWGPALPIALPCRLLRRAGCPAPPRPALPRPALPCRALLSGLPVCLLACAVLGGKPLVERQFEEDNARGERT